MSIIHAAQEDIHIQVAIILPSCSIMESLITEIASIDDMLSYNLLDLRGNTIEKPLQRVFRVLVFALLK
jgi:hypothetical protein